MCLFLRSVFRLATFPIKPRFVVLQILLSFWQVLPSQPRNSNSVRVVIGFLVTSLTKVLLAQFGQMASSRKSLGSSIFFPFPKDGAHCALENFQHSRNCVIPFLRSMLPRNCILAFHELHGGVSALTCTVNCGTLYRKVCFFLNYVQLIELATSGLQSKEIG